VAEDSPVSAVVDQRAAAVSRGVVKPVAELGGAAELAGPGVAAAMAELDRQAHGAGADQGEPVADGRAPRRGPVDHERLPSRARRGQQCVRARGVRRHGLLHHHREPALERADAELHRAPVVGEDEDGVEVFPVQQGVVARQRVDAGVRAPQALSETRIGIGRGHDSTGVAGGHRRQIPPDVIVGQSQDADAQSRHLRGVSLTRPLRSEERAHAGRRRGADGRAAPALAIPPSPSIGVSSERASGVGRCGRRPRSLARYSTPAISTRHTGPFRNIEPSKRTNAGMSPRASQ
jgi:hypothetical protein